MAVRRIVTNVAASDVSAAKEFYGNLLGLELVMDQGWILTFQADDTGPVQLSVASEGGSGTEVPDMSIEVDDVEETCRKMKAAGVPIVYDLTMEPWGVTRFYAQDPFGKVLNILSHSS